jgi:hypothetical protein
MKTTGTTTPGHQDSPFMRRLIYALTILAALCAIPLLVTVASELGLVDVDAALAALRATAADLAPLAFLAVAALALVGLALSRIPDWLEERRTDMIIGLTGRRWRPKYRIADAERAAHALIVGVSGMGKSRFLVAVIAQCLWRLREAVAVIDTHGTLVRDVVCCAPEELDERAGAIIQGGHPDYIYGVDPLRCRPGESATSRARALAQAIGTMSGDSWSARIESYLTGTFTALIEAGFTLAESPHFLADESFRAYVLGRCMSEATAEFAAGLALKNNRQLAEEISSVSVKLQAIISEWEVRALLGLEITDPAYVRHRRAHLPGYEPRVVDPMALLEAGSPVLFALTRRDLGPYNLIVAGLINAALLEAALARDDDDTGAVERITLVADELQSYASDTVVDLIEQARKFGVTLFGSCTMLHTLPPRIRTALLGVRLIAAFQVNPEDADTLAAPLFRRELHRTGQRGTRVDTSQSPGDLEAWQADQLRVTPPRSFWVYSRLRAGDATPVRTPDIEPDDDPAVDAAAREASGQRHGNPRTLVEAEFALRRAWLDGHGYLTARPLPPTADTFTDASTADTIADTITDDDDNPFA